MAEAAKIQNSGTSANRTALDRALNRNIENQDVMVDRPIPLNMLTQREMAIETSANARNGYGYTRRQAARQLARYFNGEPRVKAKVAFRFEDVNYHRLTDALMTGSVNQIRRAMNQEFDGLGPETDIERGLWRIMGLNSR